MLMGMKLMVVLWSRMPKTRGVLRSICVGLQGGVIYRRKRSPPLLGHRWGLNMNWQDVMNFGQRYQVNLNMMAFLWAYWKCGVEPDLRYMV